MAAIFQSSCRTRSGIHQEAGYLAAEWTPEQVRGDGGSDGARTHVSHGLGQACVTGAVPHVLPGSGEGCIMALGFKSPGNRLHTLPSTVPAGYGRGV